MSEIEELNSRIMAAMDRIARGVDGMEAGGGEEVAALEQALSEEKTANAQLNERIRTLGTRQAEALQALEEKAGETAARLQEFELALQRLRGANTQLVESCEALRQANADGVGDPDLINGALQAELDALRASRAADVAETAEIIAALTPLLSETAGSDAASGTPEEAR
ncbi:hypothetical protein [uncultured Roseobacter sp.]|uniref:hypothetical protein n=1 Tax=uncultured Roseobacter sp. TaxID=114847 RepID=UPI00262A3B8D|nr:hypothetical protein [uncultured Roseobacter sp.]